MVTFAVCLMGCASNKVPIGVWSSFTLTEHHHHVESITQEQIALYGACCYSDAVPHYLHRVIEDDRGWITMVGAGEGLTKSELKSTRESREWPGLISNKIRLEHVSWRQNEQLEVHRFIYDEPRSGILISLDYLMEVDHDSSQSLSVIEEELLTLLRVRGG